MGFYGGGTWDGLPLPPSSVFFPRGIATVKFSEVYCIYGSVTVTCNQTNNDNDILPGNLTRRSGFPASFPDVSLSLRKWWARKGGREEERKRDIVSLPSFP